MEIANRAEINKRLAQVENCIIEGWLTSEIVASGRKDWGLSRRQIENYISHVYKRWARESAKNLCKNLDRAIRARERIIKEARKAGDLRTALAAEDSLAKLLGLFIERVDHSGNINLTVADLVGRTRERNRFGLAGVPSGLDHGRS